MQNSWKCIKVGNLCQNITWSFKTLFIRCLHAFKLFRKIKRKKIWKTRKLKAECTQMTGARQDWFTVYAYFQYQRKYILINIQKFKKNRQASTRKIPTIQFKRNDKDRKSIKSVYVAPVYASIDERTANAKRLLFLYYKFHKYIGEKNFLENYILHIRDTPAKKQKLINISWACCCCCFWFCSSRTKCNWADDATSTNMPRNKEKKLTRALSIINERKINIRRRWRM